ncbi:TWiK family of potassium channels protein 7-like [Mya arenaria]|uniref:TWiK family of potassium channels protein 7-like n=1 Tax=Mya arenaria TaxID=6604 RepID=UPI0022E62C17|nr:TWiK family of potassium channels protein 7-like [Mya arenaria]
MVKANSNRAERKRKKKNRGSGQFKGLSQKFDDDGDTINEGIKYEEADEETDCSHYLEIFFRRFVWGFKRFITFLFSIIGVTSLTVGYAILGGLIFKGIELPQEKATRDEVAARKDVYVDKIVDFYESSNIENVLEKSTWNNKVNELLKNYEQEMFKFTKERDWNGQFEGDDFQWSFAEALLYSVTVITTIGYGNITPKTIGGRLVTILYGILGIPLAMLCLGNLGDLMAGIFRVMYRFACVNMTYQYIKLRRRRLRHRFLKRLHKKAESMKEWAKRNQSLVSSVLHLHDHTSSIPSDNNEHDVTFNEDVKDYGVVRSAQSFDNITKTLDDITDSKSNSPRRHSESALLSDTVDRVVKISRTFSLSIKPPESHARTTINELSAIPEDEIVEVTNEDMKATPLLEDCEGSTSPTISSLCLNDFDDDARKMKARLKSTRDLVPISVCMLLVTAYIIFGAVIFTSWEEWDFLTGFYFCFITLTTIGFGDFVPGMGRLDNEVRQIFVTLYLLFGMALIAMSFHLIQEEVRHKCRKMAIKIGLFEEKISKMLDSYDHN